MAHDALGAHARDELGITETLTPRPLQAACASATSFAIGAAVPLCVTAVVPGPGLIVTVSATSLAFLAILGTLAARAGGRRCFWARYKSRSGAPWRWRLPRVPGCCSARSYERFRRGRSDRWLSSFRVSLALPRRVFSRPCPQLQAIAAMSAETSVASPIHPPDRGSMIARVRTVAWTHKWLILVGIVAVGIGLWQAALYVLGPAVAVDKATRAQLVETVVATGSVQTPFRVIIGSQITGTVETVQVDEGQRVTKGQVLVSIENHELVADLAQAQGAVAQAEAHVHELADLTLPTARELSETGAGHVA